MGEVQSRGIARRLATNAGGYVRARNRKQKAAGGAGLLLAASAPFGGLNAAATPPVEEFKVGETRTIGPFEVTIEKVVTVGDLAPAITPDQEGNRLLVIDAKVRNPGTRPEYSTLLAKMFTIEDGDIAPGRDSSGRATHDSAQASLFRIADGLSPSTINPGITYDMAFVFEQEAGWTAKPVRVNVRTFDYVDEGALTLDEDYWSVDDETSLTAVIPVEVKP